MKKLFRLRNIAIFGQVIAILFTNYILDIELPLVILGLIVLLIGLFNAFVFFRLNSKSPASNNEIFIHLSIDVFALALLLYFTGGATNPFVILFLFPLTISVTILPVRYSWFLASLTVSCYSLLMINYQALPISHNMHEYAEATEYNLHLIGMWMAFILNACLITYYVYGMGNSLRHQQKQLSLAREQSIRDEQLVVLGTLAASTAHELGTPLATMALLADEIELALPTDKSELTADLSNLKSQITRCKSILNDLSASVDTPSILFDSSKQDICLYINELLSELKEQHKNTSLLLGCHIKNTFIQVDRTLSLSLINIIENAIEASPKQVEINISTIDDLLQIDIIDYGKGLTTEAQQNIGQQPYSDKALGLGLGLYLAYAAIRRRQGTIKQTNINPKGCLSSITLPIVNN